MKQHRQGDILLIPLRGFHPGEAEKLSATQIGITLALGEGSGHAHVLEAPIHVPPNQIAVIGAPEFANGRKAEIAVLWPGTLKHVSVVGEEIDHPHADQEIET